MAWALVVCAAACGVAEPRGVPTDWSAVQPWRTFQGDARHLGYVPATLDVGNFQELWRADVTTIELGPPLSEGDVLVVMSNGQPHVVEAKVAALDPTTGAEIWSREFPGWDVDDMALYGGALFFRGGQEVWSLDARTGDSLWAIDVTRHHNYRAPIVAGGQLILAGGADPYQWGGLLSLDPATGTENWFHKFVEEGGWSPTLLGTEVLVPPGGSTGGIVGRSISTGDSIYEVRDPGFGFNRAGGTPIAVGPGRVVHVQDERLVAYDPVSGQVDWELTNRYRAQPAVDDSLVFAIRSQVHDGVQTDTLHVIDLDDGSLRWALSIPGGWVERPIVATRNLVFVSNDDWTHAVDLSTREVVWRVPYRGHLMITEAGVLIIAGRGGAVHAIDLG